MAQNLQLLCVLLLVDSLFAMVKKDPFVMVVKKEEEGVAKEEVSEEGVAEQKTKAADEEEQEDLPYEPWSTVPDDVAERFPSAAGDIATSQAPLLPTVQLHLSVAGTVVGMKKEADGEVEGCGGEEGWGASSWGRWGGAGGQGCHSEAVVQ